MGLTVGDARARVETDLDDDTLKRILDSAVAAIDRAAGKSTTETETFTASGAKEISMVRRVTSITQVDERRLRSTDAVTLSANDYRLVGNYRLFRLTDGDNGFSTWGQEVVVVFVPEIDQEIRDRVALDLVQMDVEFRALDKESVGDWEGEQKDYKSRRKALLRQVREGRSPVV